MKQASSCSSIYAEASWTSKGSQEAAASNQQPAAATSTCYRVITTASILLNSSSTAATTITIPREKETSIKTCDSGLIRALNSQPQNRINAELSVGRAEYVMTLRVSPSEAKKTASSLRGVSRSTAWFGMAVKRKETARRCGEPIAAACSQLAQGRC